MEHRMEHRSWIGYFVPTEHRWINEFVGLLILTFAILLALSLVSFNPDDPSFNISKNPQFAARPSNFVGVVGSTAADLFFQTWGYSAFLLPIFLGIYGFFWLASWPMRSFGVRVAGMVLMILTFSATFALLPAFPQLRGHVPAGGLIGGILADKLEASLNGPGTAVVLMTALLVSLLLTTTFSFAWVAAFLKPRFQFISAWSERWAEWKEERARAAQQPEPKKEKTLKRQTIVTDKTKRVVAEPPEDIELDEEPPARPSRSEPVVAGFNPKPSAPKPSKSKPAPTPAFNAAEFPSTSLLR